MSPAEKSLEAIQGFVNTLKEVKRINEVIKLKADDVRKLSVSHELDTMTQQNNDKVMRSYAGDIIELCDRMEKLL